MKETIDGATERNGDNTVVVTNRPRSEYSMRAKNLRDLWKRGMTMVIHPDTVPVELG